MSSQAVRRSGRRPDLPDTLFLFVEALHAHPPRAYHNLAHVADCLRMFDEVTALAHWPDAVEFALWLHDAVYVPGRRDNEEHSALVADVVLTALGAAAAESDTVRGLILATRHDGTANAPDERLVADIDLAILGAEPARYDVYARGIRAEYAAVADAAYRAGRRRFLEHLLSRPAIFNTGHFRTTYEAAGRANLQRELSAL
ncbi:MAG: N-methyl-D-aspartate receptor NMDAR2C subunit [Planctomycetota bacterium]